MATGLSYYFDREKLPAVLAALRKGKQGEVADSIEAACKRRGFDAHAPVPAKATKEERVAKLKAGKAAARAAAAAAPSPKPEPAFVAPPVPVPDAPHVLECQGCGQPKGSPCMCNEKNPNRKVYA